MHIAPLGVHPMEREDRHRSIVVAAAADIAVGQVRRDRLLRVRFAALQKHALAGREEDDVAAGQVTGVEIVVPPVGQLPDAAAVQVRLVEMEERVLRQVRLGRLVGQVGHLRIVLRVGKEHLLAVVG